MNTEKSVYLIFWNHKVPTATLFSLKINNNTIRNNPTLPIPEYLCILNSMIFFLIKIQVLNIPLRFHFIIFRGTCGHHRRFRENSKIGVASSTELRTPEIYRASRIHILVSRGPHDQLWLEGRRRSATWPPGERAAHPQGRDEARRQLLLRALQRTPGQRHCACAAKWVAGSISWSCREEELPFLMTQFFKGKYPLFWDKLYYNRKARKNCDLSYQHYYLLLW